MRGRRQLPGLVAETRLGSIEYLAFGDGPPVLWVHGVVGGCDQGPAMSRTFVGEGFRFIAISRFGYLRSPLPPDATPAAQADLYAALLDTLAIERVALVGASAGGPSSLQFALRHPGRCAALALWSMAVPGNQVPAKALCAVMRAFFGSDRAQWLIMRYTPSVMARIMGTPPAVWRRLTPPEREWLLGVMESFFPFRDRIAGIMNDICVTNPDLNRGYPLEQVSVPTLVVHAKDDPLPSYARASRMAGQIPTARLVTIDEGGHVLLGHHARVRGEIAGFLARHTGWGEGNNLGSNHGDHRTFRHQCR